MSYGSYSYLKRNSEKTNKGKLSEVCAPPMKSMGSVSTQKGEAVTGLQRTSREPNVEENCLPEEDYCTKRTGTSKFYPRK